MLRGHLDGVRVPTARPFFFVSHEQQNLLWKNPILKGDITMNKHEIKRFVEDHKKGLIAGAVVVGGTVLMIVGFKRFPKRKHTNVTILLEKASGIKDVPIPDGLKVWDTSALWTEGGNLVSIIDSVPMDDLGELGKQYIENGLAQPGDIASIIMGVAQK